MILFQKIILILMITINLQAEEDAAQEEPPQTKSGTNLLISKSCPFKKTSQNVSQLLESTKSALQQINTTCPALKTSAQQLENVLTNSLLKQFPSEPNEDALVTNCINYQENLTYDFNLAVKMNQLDPTLIPYSYSSCKTEDTSNSTFANCAKEKYVSLLSSYADKCNVDKKIKSKSKTNQQLRTSIMSFSDQAVLLINQSSQCSDSQSARAVLQTSLSTITALSAMAPSAGLAGVGVAIVGKLVSAVIENFFSKNSPAKMLSQIQNEESMDDLNCLNYVLQKESLSCDQLIFSSQPQLVELSGEINKCQMNYYFGTDKSLASIHEISQSMKKILESTKPSEENLLDITDKLFEVFSKKIQDPLDNGNSITVLDYLTKIQKQISADKSKPSSINISNSLNNFLTAYNQLKNSQDSNAIEQFQKTAMKLANDSNSGSLFDQAITRYWDLNGASSTLAKIKNLGQLQSDLRTGYNGSVELFKALKDYEFNANSQRKVDIAHTAFVTSFKDRLQNRITDLNKRFEVNKSLQSNKDSANDLVPLIQMCTLNAGIFYFQEGNNDVKSRNNISDNIPNKYRDACLRFSCEFKIFDPDSIKDPKERPNAFRIHQCGLILKYPQILQNTIKKFEATGKTCNN